MSKLFKTGLLTTVSAAAFYVMASAPASAFDQVNWSWDASTLDTITKNIKVNMDLNPTGMVMVEDLQVFIGDSRANSTVHDVQNNQPVPANSYSGGPLSIQWHYGLDGVLLNDGFNSPVITAAHVNEDDGPNGSYNGTVTATLDLASLVPGLSFDARTELPSVVSAATAVANNASISSDVATQVHEGQFAFENNFFGGPDSSPALGLLGDIPSGNTNLYAAAALGILAITDGIHETDINAKSKVYNILNASVDSSATAVANNLTIDVSPAAGSGNRLVTGDLTQFALADVNAKSKVHDVSLYNYTNLNRINRPIVNSVATAIGNNKTITVKSPVVTP